MEADQTTAWDCVVKTYMAFTIWIYVFQVASTLAQSLRHRALMLLFNVQRYVLEWFLLTAIDFVEDYLRTGNHRSETFTTHVSDQNR